MLTLWTYILYFYDVSQNAEGGSGGFLVFVIDLPVSLLLVRLSKALSFKESNRPHWRNRVVVRFGRRACDVPPETLRFLTRFSIPLQLPVLNLEHRRAVWVRKNPTHHPPLITVSMTMLIASILMHSGGGPITRNEVILVSLAVGAILLGGICWGLIETWYDRIHGRNWPAVSAVVDIVSVAYCEPDGSPILNLKASSYNPYYQATLTYIYHYPDEQQNQPVVANFLPRRRVLGEFLQRRNRQGPRQPRDPTRSILREEDLNTRGAWVSTPRNSAWPGCLAFGHPGKHEPQLRLEGAKRSWPHRRWSGKFCQGPFRKIVCNSLSHSTQKTLPQL